MSFIKGGIEIQRGLGPLALHLLKQGVGLAHQHHAFQLITGKVDGF
jgi:hypothetical protein